MSEDDYENEVPEILAYCPDCDEEFYNAEDEAQCPFCNNYNLEEV